MTSLWYARPAAPVALRESVSAAAPVLGDGAVGWVSSATAHHMIRLVDGVPEGPDGPADLTGVFSARVFTARAELRWLHSGAGVGDAVLLTEDKLPAGWTPEPAGETGEAEEVIDGRYALWGRRFETRDSAPGWLRAMEGRIGWLDVPVAGQSPKSTPDGQKWPTEYLTLHYREYVGFDGHGNARVFEERLLRVGLAEPAEGRDE